MNFIQKLQGEVKEKQEKISSVQEEIIGFVLFLRGPKFTGTENGERKDWISTSDVILRLQEIYQLTV